MSTPQSHTTSLAEAATTVKRALPGIMVFLLGVLLPVVTLITELNSGMSASAFFDPIPTWFHVLLVALVPVGNGLVWYVLRYRRPARLGLLALLNGAVLGISGFYTVVFIPITPIAIMLFWTGLGLLPLAPVFSFVAAIICRRHLVRAMDGNALPRFNKSLWPGVALAFVLLIGVQLQTTITQYGIQLASSTDVERQARGVRLLRNWGDDDELLRASYRRTGRVPDMISFILTIGQEWVIPETVQTIFYRVTGKPFNSMPRPSLNRGGLWNSVSEFTFDRGRAGDQVAGMVKGLSLVSSTLDGSVDADAALAYLEWTFVVNNKGPFAEEARMQVALPHGATVSRVTLWVNGEPREAAFAGRAKVRQAYESIVRRSRDPLLVTMSAPDAVLLQMFPVPAGGQMKARIGITVPLLLENKAIAFLSLPYIRERNHILGPGVKHSIWIESKQRMHTVKGVGAPVLENGTYALRTTLPGSMVGNISTVIRFDRDEKIKTVFTKDLASKSHIRQRVHFEKRKIHYGVIVVDGSSTMKDYKETVAAAIEGLPADTRFSVLIAGDEVETLLSSEFGYKQMAQRIREHDFAGGTDNVQALNTAWELAARKKDSAILWLHGPQPVLLSSIDTLHNHWQRRPDRPRLFDLSVDGGHNRIAEKLVDIQAIYSVPRMGDLKHDLAEQINKLTGRRPWVQVLRTKGDALVASQFTKQTSSHLVRLWARDRVDHLTAGGKPRALRKAIKIAQTYQIVTPVSGAVVLETKAQYKRAGLKPVDAASVPTVPEPEEWAMIIITLMMLTWLRFRQRKTARLVV